MLRLVGGLKKNTPGKKRNEEGERKVDRNVIN